MEEKIGTEEIDATTLKSILVRECEKEGLDHRDFKVRISSRHTRRRRGTHFRKWNHKSEKHQHYIIIYEKSCKTLGILLKVFRHELLHSRGIDHRDMLDDFNDNGLCEENSASS